MAGFRQFGRIGTKLFSDQVFTVLADEIEQFIQPVNNSAFRDTGAVGNLVGGKAFLHAQTIVPCLLCNPSSDFYLVAESATLL